MSDDKKIYCVDCVFLNNDYECDHESNYEVNENGNWYEPNIKKYINSPCFLNNKNDCENHIKSQKRAIAHAFAHQQGEVAKKNSIDANSKSKKNKDEKNVRERPKKNIPECENCLVKALFVMAISRGEVWACPECKMYIWVERG